VREDLGVSPLLRETLLESLWSSTEGFAGVLATGDLSAAVPGCPGWDLRDLGAHLGNVHRWARGAVVEGHPRTAEVEPPAGRDALVAWYAGTAADLLATLRDAAPDAPAWTMGEPRSVRFWVRRQAHEAALHRWDAQSSQGIPEPIGAALAADGVDEVLTLFFPRQVRLDRAVEPPVAVELRAVDTGAAWRFGPGEPVGAIRGRAEDLLLLLWKRLPPRPPALAVDGDGAAVHAALDRAITP
jgi:uncharacterized protein (TIGR03083 family)